MKQGDLVRYYPLAGHPDYSIEEVDAYVPDGIPSNPSPMVRLVGKRGLYCATHCIPTGTRWERGIERIVQIETGAQIAPEVELKDLVAIQAERSRLEKELSETQGLLAATRLHAENLDRRLSAAIRDARLACRAFLHELAPYAARKARAAEEMSSESGAAHWWRVYHFLEELLEKPDLGEQERKHEARLAKLY